MGFEMRDYETIRLVSPASHVLLVTLDRPEVANAINTQMGQDLVAVFEGLAADPLAFRSVVLTGSGTRAFCAGGDLKQRNGMTDEERRAQRAVFERLTRALVLCPVPIVQPSMAWRSAAAWRSCRAATSPTRRRMRALRLPKSRWESCRGPVPS